MVVVMVLVEKSREGETCTELSVAFEHDADAVQ